MKAVDFFPLGVVVVSELVINVKFRTEQAEEVDGLRTYGKMLFGGECYGIDISSSIFRENVRHLLLTTF